ncbi:MAG: alkaline phosphatase [Planctomycetota bacterium]|nr:alkaline phosphatase [Planctomycetota bacterium]MDA1163021.1 alkaline phosphatase [Planctomycetota bacterium]
MNGRKTTLVTVTATMMLLGCEFDSAAEADHVRDLQTRAIGSGKADWGHWGSHTDKYSSWISHSNRLIPIYSFGMGLESVSGENSPYRSVEKLERLFGSVPSGTINPEAEYFDQTDVYSLQGAAAASGKKRIILFVFDGMDWQTTWAAAVYKSGAVQYRDGRGKGLAFQDYSGADTDFGYFVSSPHNDETDPDVNTQKLRKPAHTSSGGYSARFGGEFPWSKPLDPLYHIGKGREFPHVYADSASSATSLCAGIKTYNAAINVDSTGKQVEPIARQLQREGFAIGVVTSVPISHATPASAYANSVHRSDYQDLTRDLLGLRSVSHPAKALPGVDVLLGAGWGEDQQQDPGQGQNFNPGDSPDNRYLAADDLKAIRADTARPWTTVLRESGTIGSKTLAMAANHAVDSGSRLFGFFGARKGHLPFQTADGDFNPTVSAGPALGGLSLPRPAEQYSPADIAENPTLSEMTSAALQVLSSRSDRFWLMVEAGDVDWANHSNNIDDSIGAVLSGDAAFQTVTAWVEAHGGWNDTAVLVTADHGHYLVLDKPEVLVEK